MCVDTFYVLFWHKEGISGQVWPCGDSRLVLVTEIKISIIEIALLCIAYSNSIIVHAHAHVCVCVSDLCMQTAFSHTAGQLDTTEQSRGDGRQVWRLTAQSSGYIAACLFVTIPHNIHVA